MNKTPLAPAELRPLSNAELRELYIQNRTPSMRAALWEIWRLKRRIKHFHDKFVVMQKEWPSDSEGKPIGLEILRCEMRREIDQG